MAIAIFKDLCLDAGDPSALGRFWAAVLDLSFAPDEDNPDDAVLRGPSPERTIWINKVPEPKTVKHRLHLDVAPGRTVSDLEGLGATVVSREERWTVMADPEGGEFCLFSAGPHAQGAIKSLVLDSADPSAQAAWWARVLGGEAQDLQDGWSAIRNIPGTPFPDWDFVRVPEPKKAKNRWHWDVTGDAEALVSAGATVLRRSDAEISWTVLADPEGNEFCVFGH
ncbi:hypothetical protein LO762_21940 [Actinocorallia sp. API 0066]|uniref:VOC family protein n=1 Tax=Actinocorallia sp. API 0066 TaxID=2896846 RepID=UPI001E5D3631|nr:VOC family protein [Actinocorallia sp. API 0066]MCD0451836.1 hypothetical protein [Actinocorallia sp. API 0066]